MIARLARAAAWALAVALGLILSVLLAGVVNLDTPVIRRAVLVHVNEQVLAPLFRGKLEILSLGHLDAFGVSEASVRLSDSEGRPLLIASGVTARFATVALIRSLASRGADLILDLPHVSIRQLDVRLDGDAAGVAIADAFLPRHPPETPPVTPSTGRGVRLFAPHVLLEHAWAHGQLRTLPYIDGDLSRADAAFSLSPSLLTLDVRRARVVGRGIALAHDVDGDVTGHLDIALGKEAHLGGHATWDGVVGSLREQVSCAIEHGRLDAVVDVCDATPDAVRSLLPALPVTETGVAHFEAHGPLEAIVVNLHAALGAATADVQGQAQWAPVKGATLHVDVSGVDIHQFVTTVPASALALRGDLAATLSPEGRLDGQADLEIPVGHVGEHSVPRTTLKTKGFRVPGGPFGGDAAIVVEEPGLPTTLNLHAVPRGSSSSVDFTLQSRALRIDAVRRISTDASGSARLSGKGNVDLDRLAVDVAVDTRGDALSHGALRVGAIAVKGEAHGSLLNPVLNLDVQTRGTAWGTTVLSSLDVSVRGRALTPSVVVHERSLDVPDLDATLDVDVAAGPTLRNVDATLRRRGVKAHVAASRARFEHADVAVDGLVVDGLGDQVRGSFDKGGDTLRFRATAPRVDLSRVAKLLAVDEIIRGGSVSLDVALAVSAGAATGRVRVHLDHGALASLTDATFAVAGDVAGRRFTGTLAVSADDIGTASLDAKQLMVGGTEPLLDASWKSLAGDVTLAGHLDLAKVAAELPAGLLPISALRGILDLKGRLERDGASDFTPLIELDAITTGLAVAGLPSPSTHPPPTAPAATPEPPLPPSWRLEGVDLSSTVHVNGVTGATDLSVRVRDTKGNLAELDFASTELPFRAFYKSPSRALALLPRVPFEASLSLPARPVEGYPPTLGPIPLEGDLRATLSVEGSLLAPHAKLDAVLARGGSAQARLSDPVELSLSTTYDGERIDATLTGIQESRQVLSASGRVSVAARDLLAASPDLPWTASGKVHVDDFPLVTIGLLDDRQVRGKLRGDISLDGLHSDASAHAKLEVKDLKVGDAVYPSAVATLDADGKRVDARVRLDETDGFGSLAASVAAGWGAALLPVPDAKGALSVELQAKRFRAAALLPFMRGAIDELDGLVNARVTATIDPQGVRAEGEASVEDGLFRLSSFGGELHDISGEVKLARDGALTVEQLKAYGVSGELLASASARLDGLRLVAANATVQIPRSRPIPLSVEGSQVGMIDGRLLVKESLSADRKTIEIAVDVPTLHLLVPEAGSQDVQALGPIAGVVLGRRQRDGTFVADLSDPDEDRGAEAKSRAANGTQIHVTTQLGDDVSIRRGADLRVNLSGGPTVTVSDKAHVTGQVQLRNGVLNLYGKTFSIDHGTVTFVGEDSSNPQVSVTAAWSGPDRTQVYADFIGPLKTGKVVLRSEPTLSNAEIVQLLLFGTADGQSAANASASSTAGASSALGVAGSQAAQPLNRALDQFGLSAVTAKLDSSSANAKPEVEVQIARDISLLVAYVIGAPPVGSSPDKTLLTIDWRFLRKWSLAATVGDAGSTIVDLIWQYRY